MATITRITVVHGFSAAFILSDGSMLMHHTQSDLDTALALGDHWKRIIAMGGIKTDIARWGRDELEFYTPITADLVKDLELSAAEIAAAQKARAAKLAEEIVFTSCAQYMYAVWGYDQTNVTWYEIEKVTAKSVRLVEIESQQFPINPADPQAGGVSIPKPGSRRGKPFTRKRPTSDGHVRVTPYQYAHTWDGRPRSYTCGG